MNDPTDTIPDRAREAARRVLAAVEESRGENIRIETARSLGKQTAEIGGPYIARADYNTLTAIGSEAALHCQALHAWASRPSGPEWASRLAVIAEPTAALGFLRCVADHGEAEAVRRWPAPADRAPSGLDALRARHPDLLAKPGPVAVLRVLLLDRDMLWSAPALAKSDELRDALHAGKASARNVGRWLAELHGAELARAEGKGTAKRWRLGAA